MSRGRSTCQVSGVSESLAAIRPSVTAQGSFRDAGLEARAQVLRHLAGELHAGRSGDRQHMERTHCVFMVFHWPEPSRTQQLAASMREMRDALLAIPGCIGVEPPYLTEAEGAECLVGISKWESEDMFQSSGVVLRAPDEIVEGETRPRRRFFLRPAAEV
jgi:Antibiotic biosynthesis monooxygenase